jgi:outer membrane protein assembly factor BamB
MRIRSIVVSIAVICIIKIAAAEPSLNWKRNVDYMVSGGTMSVSGDYIACYVSKLPITDVFLFSAQNSLLAHNRGSGILISAIAVSNSGSFALGITEQIHPSYPGYVQCYNKDGRVDWTYNNRYGADEIQFSGNEQYVTFCDRKHLYCLNNKGLQLWRVQGDFCNCSINENGSRIVAEDIDHTLHVYDQRGNLLWKYNHDPNVDIGQASGVAISADGRYIAQCFNSIIAGRETYSVGLFTIGGQLIWEYALEGEFNYGRSIAVANTGDVIIGTKQSKVYIIDKNGVRTWYTEYPTYWDDIAYVSISKNGHSIAVACSDHCYSYQTE